MRLLALLGPCIGLLGCAGGDSPAFELPRRLEVPAEAQLTSFGALSDSTGHEVLSWVRDAALSESGRFLAVADRGEPFLRVVDRTTGENRSFGREGDGPGELHQAYSISFVGDSLLLVLSAIHRLNAYDVDGAWRSSRNLGRAGVSGFAISDACDGTAFLYGLPVGHGEMQPVPWVHELAFEAEAVRALPRFEIPGRGYHVGYGALYGFDGNDEGVLLWHRAREPHVGYWIPCGHDAVTIWSHDASEERPLEQAFATEGGRGGVALILPDTLFAGVALRGRAKIRAWSPRQPADGEPVTTFHVVEDDGCREVELMGDWRLRDGHPDGLVISTTDPFPAVHVLDWRWFEGTLRRAECAG